MWSQVFRAMAGKPDCEGAVMTALLRYVQVRCLYDVGGFWEPHPSRQSPFHGAAPGAVSPAAAGVVTPGRRVPT